MNNSDQFEGYIVFTLINEGSKSEHYVPMLLKKGGSVIELFKEGDNPYKNESFRPFHLSYCQLQGNYNKSKNFITVLDILKLDDPVAKLFEQSNSIAEDDDSVNLKKDNSDE
ncbi:MAG: hypothetical protein AB7S48_09025 [Bacteroidales bacterium]